MPSVLIGTALIVIGPFAGIVGALVLYGRKYRRWSSIQSETALSSKPNEPLAR